MFLWSKNKQDLIKAFFKWEYIRTCKILARFPSYFALGHPILSIFYFPRGHWCIVFPLISVPLLFQNQFHSMFQDYSHFFFLVLFCKKQLVWIFQHCCVSINVFYSRLVKMCVKSNIKFNHPFDYQTIYYHFPFSFVKINAPIMLPLCLFFFRSSSTNIT